MLTVPILGDDSLLDVLIGRGIQHFFVGLGSTGKIAPWRALYELARSKNMIPVNAIHPSAIVSSAAVHGLGVTIAAQAVINSCAALGDNVIVNTGAIIEHDREIASHAHISPGVVLCGGVRIGLGSHVGAGATVLQNITVGEYAIVGAGAVVISDVPSGVVVVGVPARIRPEWDDSSEKPFWSKVYDTLFREA